MWNKSSSHGPIPYAPRLDAKQYGAIAKLHQSLTLDLFKFSTASSLPFKKTNSLHNHIPPQPLIIFNIRHKKGDSCIDSGSTKEKTAKNTGSHDEQGEEEPSQDEESEWRRVWSLETKFNKHHLHPRDVHRFVSGLLVYMCILEPLKNIVLSSPPATQGVLTQTPCPFFDFYLWIICWVGGWMLPSHLTIFEIMNGMKKARNAPASTSQSGK